MFTQHHCSLASSSSHGPGWLSVWSPGQILGTRWDLTTSPPPPPPLPPATTPTLTCRSSYDNVAPPRHHRSPRNCTYHSRHSFIPRLPLLKTSLGASILFQVVFIRAHVTRGMKKSEGLNDWIRGASHERERGIGGWI